MHKNIKEFPGFNKNIYGEKVISAYGEGNFQLNFRNLYTVWKFGKPKHNYYVRNRRSTEIMLDEYDQYLIDHLKPGKTLIYDAAGYYLAEAIDDLTVIELNHIVLTWYPDAVIDTGEVSVRHLYQSADNLIVINTIRLRWKTFEEYSEYWKFQRRFLKPGAHIFFSFRDIFIFHNRLKYKFSDLLQSWLESMEIYGFNFVRLQHEIIPIDDSIIDYNSTPEIYDMINGNVKIHWEFNP